jgi:Protein of unknown function (DUF2934)
MTLAELHDDVIRSRAYAIWQEEGCPEGRSQIHWDQACREMGVQDTAPDKAPRRKPAAPRTPKSAAASAAADVPGPENAGKRSAGKAPKATRKPAAGAAAKSRTGAQTPN